MDSTEYKIEIERVRGNPARMEELYRQTGKKDELAFNKAVAECAKQFPEDLLLHAWTLRLSETGKGRVISAWSESEGSAWVKAIVLSSFLGAVYVLLAQGKPPIPFFDEEFSYFFTLGWAPLLGLSLLCLLALMRKEWKDELRHYVIGALVIVFFTLIAWARLWGTRGDAANLMALHLPFVVWAVVGVAHMWTMRERSRQVFCYVAKSLEICVAAGLFFITGGIFTGLTFGIFSVLGVVIPDSLFQRIAAWGIGVVPLLAVTSVYALDRDPLDQEKDHGIASLLTIITRLFLALVLLVLAVYVVWFIPTNFWKPFYERDVLVVYNVALIALLAFFAYVSRVQGVSARLSRWLYGGLLTSVALTFLLNMYALAAVFYRMIQWGMTPNRHAVLGWNVVTLIMFSILIFSLIRFRKSDWTDNFQMSFAKVMIFPVAWAVWVLCVTPLM